MATRSETKRNKQKNNDKKKESTKKVKDEYQFSSRSGAAATIPVKQKNKKGYGWGARVGQDPGRVDVSRYLRGQDDPEYIEEVAKDKKKLEFRKALKRAIAVQNERNKTKNMAKGGIVYANCGASVPGTHKKK